jgi:diguanylate cyclase (GGDEF)-like protein
MLESDSDTDWEVAGGTDVPELSEAEVSLTIHEIINSMEQGVLVWSKCGRCEMHNERVFDILELRSDDIFEGRIRKEFLELAVKRGEITADVAAQTEARFHESSPFAFDRQLPSGRVVNTTARPMRSGRFVVTFSDITEARHNQKQLRAAKLEAEQASENARKSLVLEKARRRQTRLLSEFDEWLHCCKSLDELLRVLGIFMERLLPGSSGQLYVYSNSRDVLDGKCSWNADSLLEFIEPDDCWSLRRGRPYSYGTSDVNLTCTHVDDDGGVETIGEYLCIPILAHGDTVGLMHIRYAKGSNMLKGNDTADAQVSTTHQFAIQCAEHISLAIANVKLRDQLQDQSTKDSLTGLFNRRYFLDSMRSAIAHAERKDAKLAVLTIDADNFKRFNDNHGHDAGDLVLRMISKSMMASCEGGQVPSRLGGEEFAILLPDMDVDKAVEFAEEFRRTIEAQVVRYAEADLPQVTVSLGVSEYPTHGTEPQELLKTADVALYHAKARGRNQTCVPDDQPECSSH